MGSDEARYGDAVGNEILCYSYTPGPIETRFYERIGILIIHPFNRISLSHQVKSQRKWRIQATSKTHGRLQKQCQNIQRNF